MAVSVDCLRLSSTLEFQLKRNSVSISGKCLCKQLPANPIVMYICLILYHNSSVIHSPILYNVMYYSNKNKHVATYSCIDQCFALLSCAGVEHVPISSNVRCLEISMFMEIAYEFVISMLKELYSSLITMGATHSPFCILIALILTINKIPASGRVAQFAAKPSTQISKIFQTPSHKLQVHFLKCS